MCKCNVDCGLQCAFLMYVFFSIQIGSSVFVGILGVAVE